MATHRTQHMNILIPDGNEQGPAYATTDISPSLDIIGEHTHDGINTGASINIAGQVISNDLSLDGYNLTNAHTLRMKSLSSTLTGISDLNQFYDVNGDLYFNDGSGNVVRLTQSGQPVGPVNSLLSLIPLNVTNTNHVLLPGDNYNLINVSTTTSAVTITLPIAVSVPSGRFYYIVDTGGNAGSNNITIQVSVGSGNTILVPVGNNATSTTAKLQTNSASCIFYTDGSSHWYLLELQRYRYSASDTVTFDVNATLKMNGVLDFGSGPSIIIGQAAIGGRLIANTFNSINGAIAGGIQSSTPGAFQLAGGSTDWVTFSAVRGRNLAYPITLGQTIDGTNWTYINGSVLVSDVNNNSLIQPLSIPLVHNGATLDKVEIYFSVGQSHPNVPDVLPSLVLKRAQLAAGVSFASTIQDLSTTAQQFFPNPGSGANWYSSGNVQILTYNCNQHNVIDNTTYLYYLNLQDEHDGGNSFSLSGNKYYGMILHYSHIPDTSWST